MQGRNPEQDFLPSSLQVFLTVGTGPGSRPPRVRGDWHGAATRPARPLAGGGPGPRDCVRGRIVLLMTGADHRQNSGHLNGSLNGSPVQEALEREEGLNGRSSRSGKLRQALKRLVADREVMQDCHTNPNQ